MNDREDVQIFLPIIIDKRLDREGMVLNALFRHDSALSSPSVLL